MPAEILSGRRKIMAMSSSSAAFSKALSTFSSEMVEEEDKPPIREKSKLEPPRSAIPLPSSKYRIFPFKNSCADNGAASRGRRSAIRYFFMLYKITTGETPYKYRARYSKNALYPREACPSFFLPDTIPDGCPRPAWAGPTGGNPGRDYQCRHRPEGGRGYWSIAPVRDGGRAGRRAQVQG